MITAKLHVKLGEGQLVVVQLSGVRRSAVDTDDSGTCRLAEPQGDLEPGRPAGAVVAGQADVGGRFPTADHFASCTGTSPLDASSGNRNRHRLKTGGNRQLNSALHTITVCQARAPGPGRAYYLRKISEGKTPAEARRVLKRRLANDIYRHIRKDQKRRPVMTPLGGRRRGGPA